MKKNLKQQNILLISIHRKPLQNLYEKCVEKPVPTKILKKLSTNKMILSHKDIRVWSVINTKENYEIWKDIRKNDVVMFLKNKKFFSRAKVISTSEYNHEGAALGNSIEFSTKHNLLIFLETIIPIDLDYHACIPALIEPHMPAAYFFSITRINDQKKHLLVTTFGSLENAIEFLGNPQKKNSSISDYMSEKKLLDNVSFEIKSRLAKQRINQQKFRKNVLVNFSYTCAACRISDSALLEAAHIIPVNNKNSAGKTDNGICLCSNCHKLFDCGFFSFNEDYKIIFSSHKKISNRISVMLKNRMMCKSKILPSKEYLSLHRAKYGIRG